MEAAIKSVLPVYAVGRRTYAGKVLMLFLTNKDHQSPMLAVGKASLAAAAGARGGGGGLKAFQILPWQQEGVGKFNTKCN